MLGLETPLLLVVRLVEGKVKRENGREGGREKEERGDSRHVMNLVIVVTVL